jgi:hypothetical protein
MQKCSEELKSTNQGRWRMEEYTRVKAGLLLHAHELIASLEIKADLIANLGLVHLVWLSRVAINPTYISRGITITFLMV